MTKPHTQLKKGDRRAKKWVRPVVSRMNAGAAEGAGGFNTDGGQQS